MKWGLNDDEVENLNELTVNQKRQKIFTDRQNVVIVMTVFVALCLLTASNML